jgi:hypothetical protein
MATIGIFHDAIGPVMRGLSSSHCAAALRIGRLARDLMGGDIAAVLVEFGRAGSLPTTQDSLSCVNTLCRDWGCPHHLRPPSTPERSAATPATNHAMAVRSTTTSTGSPPLATAFARVHPNGVPHTARWLSISLPRSHRHATPAGHTQIHADAAPPGFTPFRGAGARTLPLPSRPLWLNLTRPGAQGGRGIATRW